MFLTVKTKRENFRYSLFAIRSLIPLFLITLSTLNAQVVIKEKVEINPQSNIIPDSPIQGHNIRVDLQWTPEYIQGSISFFDLDCGSASVSGLSNGGSLSHYYNSNGYDSYNIQFYFLPCTQISQPEQITIEATYQLYFDGILVRSSSFNLDEYCTSNNNSVFTLWNTAYMSPIFPGYNFQILGEEFCFNESRNLTVSTQQFCSTTVEIDSSKDSISIMITNGNEYISFYKNGIKSDTVNFFYREKDSYLQTIKNVNIKVDGYYDGAQPLDVIIKSNWADEIRYDTIKINPQTPTEIYISSQQPIIVSSGGISGVQVNSVAGYGTCATELPDSIKYKAAIIKGQQLGNLV